MAEAGGELAPAPDFAALAPDIVGQPVTTAASISQPLPHMLAPAPCGYTAVPPTTSTVVRYVPVQSSAGQRQGSTSAPIHGSTSAPIHVKPQPISTYVTPYNQQVGTRDVRELSEVDKTIAHPIYYQVPLMLPTSIPSYVAPAGRLGGAISQPNFSYVAPAVPQPMPALGSQLYQAGSQPRLVQCPSMITYPGIKSAPTAAAEHMTVVVRSQQLLAPALPAAAVAAVELEKAARVSNKRVKSSKKSSKKKKNKGCC